VFRLTAPSENEVRRFISDQKDSRFSYSDVGASATAAPTGYNLDHTRCQLGRGEAVWRRAKEAVRGWRMFSISWVNLHWSNAPIEAGTDVAVSVRLFGFHSLNACRIVYVVDEERPVKRFGFAYGTLLEHAESGEERFTVEWDDQDNVWYEILAFSRPRQFLARLGYPLSRSLQKKFARASMVAMFQAVSDK
jgi:uncharacterized protein (UPF0548 family)